jgi:prepilin-type N-terminal cleavage/methylation domain-containing protein
MKNNRKGFTLVEIMIVVAIIAMLAAIAIPSFTKSRTEARKNACINNLRLIDHAKQQLGMFTNWPDANAMALSDVQPYLKATPVCRAGGTYTVGILASNPTCSVTGHSL